MARHSLFTNITGVKVYFAHPRSPWERGTNENTNGLIRQFFPKGTDFNKISRYEVKKVQDLLNGRPRQALDFQKPYEVFTNSLTICCVKFWKLSFIFTAPIPPPVVCGLMKSIEIVEKETWRREKVLKNAKYLREKLQELKLDLENSNTQIIPIIIGDEKKTMEASKLLLENNIFIPTARWPAVPKGKARLRITVTCEHTKNQLDNLFENMKKIKNILKF